MEEHHTLMGAVMEIVWSAKSGLTEAYNSLLTGFEVSDVIFFTSFHFVYTYMCLGETHV